MKIHRSEKKNIFLKVVDYHPVIGRCGVVVKTPARESEDPGFDSRLTMHRNCRRLLNAFVIECD